MSRFHDEFFRQKGAKHDELVMQCVSSGSMEFIIKKTGAWGWIVDLPTPEERIKFDYETEVLCQSHGYKSNFIIGYADIIIRVWRGISDDVEKEFNERVKLLIETYKVPPNEAKRSASNYLREGGVEANYLVNILVECKPNLTDIGAVIRQIKTYESLLMHGRKWYKVIATYSNPSQKIIDFLKHDGIEVIIFEEVV